MFKDEMTNSVAGLLRELFGWIVNPIKGLILSIAGAIGAKIALRRLRSEYAKLTYTRMLHNFCKAHNIGLLVFDLHNGVKSISGYSFLKLGTVFLEDTKNSVFLNELSKVSVPASIYAKLVDLCYQKTDIAVADLRNDVEIQQLFSNYRRLWCRHGCLFYVAFADDDAINFADLEPNLTKLMRSI